MEYCRKGININSVVIMEMASVDQVLTFGWWYVGGYGERGLSQKRCRHGVTQKWFFLWHHRVGAVSIDGESMGVLTVI